METCDVRTTTAGLIWSVFFCCRTTGGNDGVGAENTKANKYNSGCYEGCAMEAETARRGGTSQTKVWEGVVRNVHSLKHPER